ncbi:MAG: methyltransferase [Deltaproteobacteria bacterium]|nr:methyltransferase [Deltaproteobacteria bacterium]
MKPMSGSAKRETRAYGIRVLLSRHPEIRRLKRLNTPMVHGTRHWNTSWLLIDYLKRHGLPRKAHVMELGCGWGLAGIYCAKKHGATVTCVDIDAEVFPYLRLHADINKVDISVMNKGFDGLTGRLLKGVDVLIGADICFWDNMIDPLKRLILRALRKGVRLVVIADPGRSPFHQLCEYFLEKRGADALDWTTGRPRRIGGRLLTIGSG